MINYAMFQLLNNVDYFQKLKWNTSLFKMAGMNISCCCTFSITTFYVGSRHKILCCDVTNVFMHLRRHRIESDDTCSFQDTECIIIQGNMSNLTQI